MAEAQIRIGGVIDVATGAEVQSIVDGGVDKILGRIPSKDRGIRKRQVASVSQNPAATGTLCLDFGSPPAGKLWWVQEVVITGGDDHTALSQSIVNTGAVNAQAAPAAGTETITTVPANETWQITGWNAVLVTSATVANRTVNLVIDDGAGHTLFQTTATTAQAASLTTLYEGVSGQPENAAVRTGNPNNYLMIEFPTGMTLQAGYRIRTVTTNLQAGDQWGVATTSYLRTVAATAGSVQGALYVGTPPLHQNGILTAVAGNAPILGTLVRPAISLPGFHPFSGEAFPVLESENLFEMVYLNTAVATISGVATIVEIDGRAVLIDIIR